MRRKTELSRPEASKKKPPLASWQRDLMGLISPKPPRPDLKPARPPLHVATKMRKLAVRIRGQVLMEIKAKEKANV